MATFESITFQARNRDEAELQASRNTEPSHGLGRAIEMHHLTREFILPTEEKAIDFIQENHQKGCRIYLVRIGENGTTWVAGGWVKD